MIRSLLFPFFLLYFNLTFSQNQATLQALSPAAFRQATEQEGVQLVDVRTASEVASGKINRAVNYDVNSPSFAQSCQQLDKQRPVYLYCLSGIRSERAANQLINLGYSRIFHLQGGLRAWQAAGFPVAH